MIINFLFVLQEIKGTSSI